MKRDFTSEYLAVSERERRVTAAQSRDRRRGIWQPRFWEHRIRDESDLERHLNDIHYNPVKHGLAMCPHHWPYSSFGKWTRSDVYEPTWQCACDGRRPEPMNFDDLPLDLME